MDEIDISRMCLPSMTPPVIILVDAEEYYVFDTKPDRELQDSMFRTAIDERGGEVAVMVYKPKYGIYLRESMSITARK